jgi:multidrug efflux pump
MYVQDRAGLGFGELEHARSGAGCTHAADAGVRSVLDLTSFQANVPQLDAVVDRARAKQQGVALTDLYETMQVYLGSAYVNDFNLFGRTYTVYAQADAKFRDESADISRLKVRNASGQMVPLGGIVEVSQSYGPDPVVRFNGYPAADISGGMRIRADVESAEALETAAQLARETLPSGMSFEWSGLTYQQVTQGRCGAAGVPAVRAVRVTWCSRRCTRAGRCRSR